VGGDFADQLPTFFGKPQNLWHLRPKSPPTPLAKGRTILILRTESVILFELYFSSPVKCRKEIFRRENQFDIGTEKKPRSDGKFLESITAGLMYFCGVNFKMVCKFRIGLVFVKGA